ncbi:MAG: class I SAM-dependent methyltransferase, partial [Thermoanaerobaculia bacterium]
METAEYQRNYGLEQSYWWFAGVRAMVRNLLAASGASSRLGRVLDVGCGTGALIDELKGRADSIRGVDFSPEALRFGARRGLKCVALADARRVPFPDASFDLVTAIG